MFFLPVQFVAHTTAEWAGSTPRRPPTLGSVLRNEKPGLAGSFHADTSEPAAAADALSSDSSELQRCCSYSLISCVSAETQPPVETEPE